MIVAVLSSEVSAVPLVAVAVIVAVPTPTGVTHPLLSILAVVLPAYLFFAIVFLIVGDKDRNINNVLKI